MISEPVWWIKADMEVMRLNFPFLWQVIGLGSICPGRDSLWTRVGGCCCPAVLWNSIAWCSYTENKKKIEFWLLWFVDKFSEDNVEERAVICVMSCASTQANLCSNTQKGDSSWQGIFTSINQHHLWNRGPDVQRQRQFSGLLHPWSYFCWFGCCFFQLLYSAK